MNVYRRFRIKGSITQYAVFGIIYIQMKAIDNFTKQLVGTEDVDFIIDTSSCYSSAHFEHG